MRNIHLQKSLAVLIAYILIIPAIVKAEPAPGFLVTPSPKWAKIHKISPSSTLNKAPQETFQWLLLDTQQHWPNQTTFYRYAVSILTQSAVERLSQIQIGFDPSYMQVLIHKIRVFRNGKWIDRLQNAHHRLLKQEKNLTYNLADGTCTLVFFLEDIRSGDLLDYSYSLVGQSSLSTNHYADQIYLQGLHPTGTISHRFLTHPNHNFTIKSFNTDIKPKKIKVADNLVEWSWKATDTPAGQTNDHSPSWYNPYAYVQLSQYNNWGEVVDLLKPLYLLPRNFKETLPKEMKSLVKRWQAYTTDKHLLAQTALRFVQDEIRYVGLEEGIRAFTPDSPGEVFQRRFGDCKNKSFLLLTLLRMMDIDSSIALVNQTLGKSLKHCLPAPFLFNHAILNIKIGNKNYWVDPTLSLQGGAIENIHCSDFQWGLLLSNESQKLTHIPAPVLRSPIQIQTTFDLLPNKSLEMTFVSTFHGSQAEYVRNLLAWQGMKEFSKGLVSSMQVFYKDSELKQPISVLDNRDGNIFSISERYILPVHNEQIAIYPLTTNSYFDRNLEKKSISPKALNRPLWVHESIHIKHPQPIWGNETRSKKFEHPSLTASYNATVQGNDAHINFKLKHLNDHVSPQELRAYESVMKQIDEYSSFTFDLTSNTKPKDYVFPSLGIVSLLYWIFDRVRPKQQRD